jgi:acid stress-induced BolA-like protein IbaG/YrbA
MVTPQDIENWIQAGLPGTEISVDGDGHHFEAMIVNPDFAGKSLIQRHQMVYGALGDRMKAEIHALSMKTLTPEEYSDLQSN